MSETARASISSRSLSTSPHATPRSAPQLEAAEPTTTSHTITKQHSTSSNHNSPSSKLCDPNLVTWSQNDPENPQNWSQSRKTMLLIVVSTCAFCVTNTSSIISNAYQGIQNEFHISKEVAILGLSLFVIGLGIGPMLLGPLSEFYGRRPVYLVSYTAFTLLGLPVSFANNLAVFLIFRFLTGFCGSAFLSVAGGTVSDVFAATNIFVPMAIYTNGPFLGPVFGPLLSGFINQNTNWRWTFWTINIWSSVMLLILIFFGPESYAPVLLANKARRLRFQTGNNELYAQHEKAVAQKSLLSTIVISTTRPFQLLVQEVMLLLLCLWSALLLGILYLFFVAFPIVFEMHGFNLQEIGLSFLGIGTGMIAAVCSMPFWAKHYTRLVETKGNGVAEPEFRLPVAMVGAVCLPIGMFWFAFTTYTSVHWIVPILGTVVFGFGISYVFTAVFTYTTHAYRPVAASAMAANSFCRSTWAAAFPLFARQMYDRMTPQGASAYLAALNVIMIPVPFLLYKYGKRIRAKSQFTLS
ncbi:related to multidrug resistant protein [Melanopsichium pennsylvanicum]|uniref:Related to multidrug resistant protein n=2 Tax=Melanopsichium pennsylvanicum TaxID=63383 RepID=A0AAJ4XM17_9BASI|nr:related to multidrug resistant protein [Melanopsichium pennsylvanicum 4]SNX84327.1 related to multidrug resistant protein [Melanopsichium pennsylvanicum]